MTSPKKFPDGSASDQRYESACIRAIDPWLRLERQADRVIEALDQVTTPGIVRAPLAEDDSLIIAIRDAAAGGE